ncbi:MAG: hypothetical protein EXX96DRAFT_590509 [Benjaminiella poitrasii]|nr:MAG: hypothetical protein EXX96DRAFT_590509 [Benjaminiella poitrasii]
MGKKSGYRKRNNNSRKGNNNSQKKSTPIATPDREDETITIFDKGLERDDEVTCVLPKTALVSTSDQSELVTTEENHRSVAQIDAEYNNITNEAENCTSNTVTKTSDDESDNSKGLSAEEYHTVNESEEGRSSSSENEQERSSNKTRKIGSSNELSATIEGQTIDIIAPNSEPQQNAPIFAIDSLLTTEKNTNITTTRNTDEAIVYKEAILVEDELNSHDLSGKVVAEEKLRIDGNEIVQDTALSFQKKDEDSQNIMVCQEEESDTISQDNQLTEIKEIHPPVIETATDISSPSLNNPETVQKIVLPLEDVVHEDESSNIVKLTMNDMEENECQYIDNHTAIAIISESSQQSVSLTETTTTVNYDDEIEEESTVKDKAVSSNVQKKSNTIALPTKGMSKRKSQILINLFKRTSLAGIDKAAIAASPHAPELEPEEKKATIAEKMKKLNKRKSWMFWKFSQQKQ